MAVLASADWTGSRAAGYVGHVTQREIISETYAYEELFYGRLQASNSLMLARFSLDLMDFFNAPTLATNWLANGFENEPQANTLFLGQ